MAKNFTLASFFICRLLLESIFGERKFQFVKKVSRLEQIEVTICALSRIMSERKSELNTDDNFKGKAFDHFTTLNRMNVEQSIAEWKKTV